MEATMLRMVVLMLGLSVITLGCGNDGPTAPSDVSGNTWRLVGLQEAGDSTTTTVRNPERYSVTFGNDGRMTAISDCNSCGGSYTIAGSTLTVSGLACTKVFCGDISVDPRFTAILETARTIDFTGSHDLLIHGVAGTLRFRN
jgi:heat shock protein HslJ